MLLIIKRGEVVFVAIRGETVVRSNNTVKLFLWLYVVQLFFIKKHGEIVFVATHGEIVSWSKNMVNLFLRLYMVKLFVDQKNMMELFCGYTW